MTWGKVSDDLHSDEKWRGASKGGRALWTTALSWCAEKGNGGRVPRHMLAHLDGSAADVKSLVTVGFWDVTDEGWQIRNWDRYNESEEVARARKVKRAAASAEANHVRWHVRRGVRIDSCDLCIASDLDSDSDRSADSGTESVGIPPVPVPVPGSTEVLEEGNLSSAIGPPSPFCLKHMPSGPNGHRCAACADAKRAWEAAGKPPIPRVTPSPTGLVDRAACKHSAAIRTGLDYCGRCDSRLIDGCWSAPVSLEVA